MSHRWDCPTDYEAEREGRRDGEAGYKSRYSNPYSEFGFQPCEEAAENWERGFRAGEHVREEREEEERYAERQARRRAEDAAEEAFYIQQQEVEQYQEYPEYGPEPDQCIVCHETFCPHGFCRCNEQFDPPTCPDCAKRRQDELDAEREANFQKNVAGPLLGFTETKE